MDKHLSRKSKSPRSVAPRKLPPRGVGGAVPTPKAEGDDSKISAHAIKILAVDDTAGDLRDLRNALKSNHIQVFTCSNGRAALDFVKGELVDLILLDVLMPEMTGYEVCRELKHNHRTQSIPVIFITGNIQTEDMNLGLEVGAWDYISKPINSDEVMLRVNNALAIKRARDKLKVSTIVPDEEVRDQLALQQKMEEFRMGMMTTHWHKRFGQLSANFVEEMKGPLASALGNIRMLMVDERMEGRHRQKLAMVYAHFRKTEEMLKRLLNVAERIPSPQIVTVAQVVNDSLQLMNLELQYYQIKMVLQLDPTAQWVGIPSELGRAVLYLLHNAIEAVTYRPRIYPEFTNEDGAEPPDMGQSRVADPEIRVTVELDEGQINIHVMDNGPGIEKEQFEQIFEPFFTGKSAPHTGAGLHLARAIARAGGGEVAVFSPNANGLTQFTIALPQFDPTLYEGTEEAPDGGGELEKQAVEE